MTLYIEPVFGVKVSCTSSPLILPRVFLCRSASTSGIQHLPRPSSLLDGFVDLLLLANTLHHAWCRGHCRDWSYLVLTSPTATKIWLTSPHAAGIHLNSPPATRISQDTSPLVVHISLSGHHRAPSPGVGFDRSSSIGFGAWLVRFPSTKLHWLGSELIESARHFSSAQLVSG
jgi:hypothetical protein